MACDDVVDTFVQYHFQSQLQTVHQANRWCVWEGAVIVPFLHVLDVKEGARQISGIRGNDRFFGKSDDGQTCRQHEAFLAAGYGDIDAPLVKPEIH